MTSPWLAAIDNYCERTDAGFWSEPLNAVSNGAFLVAAAYAFILWRRKGTRDGPGLWLICVTAVIGIGSFLFHTFANRWSALADVLPIAIFIYSYFALAMRRYLKLGLSAAALATILFAVLNLAFGRLWFSVLPGMTLNGSVGYIPAALAMLGVSGVCLVRGHREAGKALLAAAGLFALSLFFRSIDSAVCAAWPTGTHFLWHALNALVLGVLMRAAITHQDHEGSRDAGD